MHENEFIRLMLEVNKHTDGFVDAYYGPKDIGEKVKSGALIPRPELKAQLNEFEANFSDADQQRQAYIMAMVRAAKTALVLDTEENPPYEDEVRLLFDIEPELIDTSIFDEANTQLSDLLPGTGTIPERTKAYFDHYILDSDKIDTAIQICLEESRKRTAQLIDLVEGEGFTYAVVNDKPWAAYNWYQGNAQSLIEFNSDIPMNALYMLVTCAHEGYPGHHTENMLKERLLYQKKGHSEYTVVLLLSPAAVIAEGIATTALEIIFPNDTADEWMDNELFPAIGIKPHSADVRRAIRKARKKLGYVSRNAAVLHNTGQLNADETIAYVQKYSGVDEQRAKQSFRFITATLSRAYVFTYTTGYDLIENAANGDKTDLFKRLLTEAMLPSDLANC